MEKRRGYRAYDKPGPDLDHLIHTKIMGLTITEFHPPEGGMTLEPGGVNVTASLVLPSPPYSTSIAAAWEVVNLLWDRDWHLKLERVGVHYECSFMHELQDVGTEKTAIAMEAPHAICLAALKACGVEI